MHKATHMETHCISCNIVRDGIEKVRDLNLENEKVVLFYSYFLYSHLLGFVVGSEICLKEGSRRKTKEFPLFSK